MFLSNSSNISLYVNSFPDLYVPENGIFLFNFINGWTFNEWLINYQGGFVRRGFIGEIVYRIHEFSGLNLRYLVFYFEIFLLAIFFVLIYNFFKKTYLNELLIFLFFCPIFLIYPLAENEVLVRKEYIFFSP